MTTLAFIMFDGAGGAAGGWAAGRLYQVRKNTFVNFELRYESSTLILYKELSSTIFQSLSVRQGSVTPVQISTLCNI